MIDLGNLRKKKVMVSMPTHRGVPLKQTNLCIQAAMAFLERKGFIVHFHDICSPSIAANRNDGAKVAQEAGADWLFFIDDDMVFDEDMIYRILQHDLDVCGGLCVRKVWPYNPAVGKKIEDQPGIYTQICNFGDEALYECDIIGTAFLAIKMTVFDKLKKPYFAMPPTRMVLREWAYEEALKKIGDKSNGDRMSDRDIILNEIGDVVNKANASIAKADETLTISGEDVYWCRNVQKAGFKLWCDSVAMIGHLGEYAYSYMDTLRAKERVEAEGGVDHRFDEIESGEGKKA